MYALPARPSARPPARPPTRSLARLPVRRASIPDRPSAHSSGPGRPYVRLQQPAEFSRALADKTIRPAMIINTEKSTPSALGYSGCFLQRLLPPLLWPLLLLRMLRTRTLRYTPPHPLHRVRDGMRRHGGSCCGCCFCFFRC